MKYRYVDLIKRTLDINVYSKVGKIVSENVGGTYNVELNSGETLTYVTPQSFGSNYKFQEGQFVTLEKTGGDWQIAGFSALRGGD